MAFWRKMMRVASIKKWILTLIITCLVVWGLVFMLEPFGNFQRKEMPFGNHISPRTSIMKEDITKGCLQQKLIEDNFAPNIGKPGIDFELNRAVLIFSECENSSRLRRLKILLTAQRIFFDILTWNNPEESSLLSLPRLYNNGTSARYGGFIFDNSEIYLRMDEYNKDILHSYCKKFNFGIIMLSGGARHKEETEYLQYGNTQLWIKKGVRGLYDTELNPKSSILEITKAGEIFECGVHRNIHSVFLTNHSTYEPVSYSFRDTLNEAVRDESIEHILRRQFSHSKGYRVNRSKFITIVHDKGYLDSVRKVFFGTRIDSLWQYQLIFLDALSAMSRGGLARPLTRWMLIDIDDIFVAHKGIRMKRKDVQALIESQSRLAKKIPNFHFNLGFSGFYYKNGSPEENEGDEMLLANAQKFWWFPHMYKHQKPHTLDGYETLVNQMKYNKEFAKLHGLPIASNYSVSPHHSGVYPVHEDLYNAWKEVWGIKVTSTEEYPHLYPAWMRRGFIHRDIMVLPRQTCGLFTRTLFWKEYPRGRKRLENSIHGGELFMTIVNNPISIFMTHFGNYGNDRLAIYTFETVVDFIQKWTNLKLVTEEPMKLGKKYFELFPEDTLPLWQNPCEDPRHLNIWAANKTCNRLPKLLIIGPQKTGTTALHAFLSLNPKFVSNHLTKRSYEEVQFFNNDNNYINGLDWYMEKFSAAKNKSDTYYFEKSANYFDSSKAYKRAVSLVPKAKLIIIAGNPIQRAYSWYHHVLSKSKPETIGHSFYDVITGKVNTLAMEKFGRRCLIPGLYAAHLENWLSVYPPEQILILDGDQLRYDPASALENVQKFLKIGKFNYKDHIVFNTKKGFFCPRDSKNGIRCLGRGKGRKYPKMDYRSESFLQDYYRLSNLRFAQLLRKHKWPLPKWLKKETENVSGVHS
eukprot:gene12046-13289_t